MWWFDNTNKGKTVKNYMQSRKICLGDHPAYWANIQKNADCYRFWNTKRVFQDKLLKLKLRWNNLQIIYLLRLQYRKLKKSFIRADS